MFLHGYNSYMKYAYPHDELMPLSCRGRARGVTPSRGDIDDSLGKYVFWYFVANGSEDDIHGSFMAWKRRHFVMWLACGGYWVTDIRLPSITKRLSDV